MATVIDAAGCGDWLTAAFVNEVGRSGLVGFTGLSRSELRAGLAIGQASAAWNCHFEGARGGMYACSPDEYREAVRGIVAGRSIAPLMRPAARLHRCRLQSLCLACSRSSLD